MRRHSVLAPLFAALIVLSVFSGAVPAPSDPIGPAAAADDSDQSCDTNMEYAIYIWTLSFVGDPDQCSPAALHQTIDDLQDNYQNQTKTSIYESMVEKKAADEVFFQTYNNGINTSESYVWMQVEKEVAQAYENGSTKSEARFRARQVIEDYYAKKQINLIEKWNTTITAIDSMEHANNASGIVDYYVRSTDSNDDYYYVGDGGPVNSTSSITLVNGSQHGIQYFGFGPSGAYYNRIITEMEGYQNVLVQPPTGNYNDITYDLQRYRTAWYRIETHNDDLISKSDAFVNNTYQGYVDGDLNASDVISSHTALIDLGTDSQDLPGVLAWFAASGHAMPENVGHMQISYQNELREGLVLADSAPNGSWQAGRTYDPDAINGQVWFASTNGYVTTLEGNFSILSIIDKNGSEIESADADESVVQTANVSDLLDQQQRLLDLIDKLQQRREDILSGDSSGSAVMIGDEGTFILIGAVVVGLILLFKD